MRGKQVTGGDRDEAARNRSETSEAVASPDETQFGDEKLVRLLIVAGILLSGLVAWVAGHSDDGGSTGTPAAAPPPRFASVQDLEAASETLGHDIYWAGPIAGRELVLRELGEGGVQVIYLPSGTGVDQIGPNDLTIGSYPLADPASATENLALEPGSRITPGVEGRQVVVSGDNPTSAYFADPDNDVQVEVYDPSPQAALELARSNRVQDVD